ncbi:MAG: rhodanese-like domain-containing protein [Prolixibacteraceae bacterium]
MHIHETNPWKTLIALSAFVILVIIGFVTMRKPMISYQLDMAQSVKEIKNTDAVFYPWQLAGFISKETKDVVLFDIRDHFTFGQGHIPGAENLSAHELTREESIERLEELKEKNITVVLYGQDQLQANAPCMLFRQIGLRNVKVLLGGYEYYAQHKDNLMATKSDTTFLKENQKYNFAEMAKPQEGTAVSQTTEKKPVVVRQRKEGPVAAGGC